MICSHGDYVSCSFVYFVVPFSRYLILICENLRIVDKSFALTRGLRSQKPTKRQVIPMRFKFDKRKSAALRKNRRRGIGFEEAQESLTIRIIWISVWNSLINFA